MTENQIIKLRKQINDRVIELGVEDKHDDTGHFYHVPETGETYGSVTGLQWVIKDKSIEQFMKNEALRYIRANFEEMNSANLDEYLFDAGQASIVKRDDAGDIGRRIHDYREDYFNKWIETNKQPNYTIEDMARKDPMNDSRIISGCAAIDRFIKEQGYIPLGCELRVYSAKWRVAGMLDDVGLLPVERGHKLVLMDLKTSNQFKDFYWVQVAAYYRMFTQLFHKRPSRLFILKAGKEHRDYKIEDITDIKTAVGTVDTLVKLGNQLKTIKAAREPDVVEI